MEGVRRISIGKIRYFEIWNTEIRRFCTIW